MPEATVTSDNHIPLTEGVRNKLGIRAGDKVIVNALGHVVLVAKRDPEAFRDVPSFLTDDFEEVLSNMRGDAEDG